MSAIALTSFLVWPVVVALIFYGALELLERVLSKIDGGRK
jgi:hypothetical protein